MGNNYLIFRAGKIKTHQEVINVLKEQHRDENFLSHRADSSRTNSNSYSSNYQDAIGKFDELLPKKIRKNAVLGLNFLVSTSEEFKDAAAEEDFYEKAREYIGEKFGQIVGWAIHRDETSTHMQVVTIPLVDGKLNAKELIGGKRHRMREIQTDFFEKVGEEFGLVRGRDSSETKAVHKTVEEYHQEEKDKLQEEQNRLSEERERLSEGQNKLSEDKAKLQEEQVNLATNKIELQSRAKDLHQRITDYNKKMDQELEKVNATTALIRANKYNVKNPEQILKDLFALAKAFFESQKFDIRKKTNKELQEEIHRRERQKKTRESGMER